MQGWGPQGGQPPFPLGSGGSQIGQLNPLYDITGGFSKEAQRMVDRLVKEMGVEGRKSAYESVLQPGAVKVFARHPNWAMPKDQLNGTAPASPQRWIVRHACGGFYALTTRLVNGQLLLEGPVGNGCYGDLSANRRNGGPTRHRQVRGASLRRTSTMGEPQSIPGQYGTASRPHDGAEGEKGV